MSDFGDKVIADLEQRATDALDQSGGLVADDIRDQISVPVGYRIGPRGGVTVIRSKPGEPPRRETGDYQSSIDHQTATDGSRVTTSIFTDDPIGGYLENGTSRMAKRPHFKPVFDEYAADAARRIGERMFRK